MRGTRHDSWWRRALVRAASTALLALVVLTGTAPAQAHASLVGSDPAEGEESGDWSGEGGATGDGPATDTD